LRGVIALAENSLPRNLTHPDCSHPGTFSLDVIVRTPGEFLERQRMRDWFMRDIAREGKVLYAA
jgi:hypothetical protein